MIALITPPGGVNAPGSRATVAASAAAIAGSHGHADPLLLQHAQPRLRLARWALDVCGGVLQERLGQRFRECRGRLLNRVQKPPTVILGGPAVAVNSWAARSEDLGKAEGLAFPILFILSLFVFRGVVAALMPLFVGGITVCDLPGPSGRQLVLRCLNSR